MEISEKLLADGAPFHLLMLLGLRQLLPAELLILGLHALQRVPQLLGVKMFVSPERYPTIRVPVLHLFF